MKKNNKGFTLIELLAAIVIMGILMAFAVPTIFRMLDDNKDKMYIDVTKKLVAQAEYKMRSSSSSIEKPEEGDSLIMSMVYLDSNDFDNAPNKGEFLKEASFVVVKNMGGNKLEYSATVVEKMKNGGYKGVQLTKSSNLEKKDANKYVKIFNESDIIYVEGKDNKNALSVNYINENIGNNYCNNIEMIYNYPGLVEDNENEKNSPPKIISVKIISNDKNINSFSATLEVEASDDKTLTKNLTVHFSFNSYDEASSSPGEKYGDNGIYTKKITFPNSNNGYDGTRFKVYVVVKDSANNFDRKVRSYKIHENKAPIIIDESTSLEKQDSDKVNMPKAVLRLNVDDDVDAKRNLNVCLSVTDTCIEYEKYKDKFDSEGKCIYDFSGNPDGREVQLNVFVKDSEGKVTKKTFDYKIYDNLGPEIDDVKTISGNVGFTSEDDYDQKGGSLSLKFTIEATHEIDLENAKVRIRIIGTTQAQEYNYKKNKFYYFNIDGEYDGSEKLFSVTLTDRFGKSKVVFYHYKLYKNEAPKIENVTIRSKDDMCSPDEDCGGSIDTGISLEVSDDMIINNNYDDIKACVSDKDDVCTENNLENFTSFKPGKEIDLKLSNGIDEVTPYNGKDSNKTIYIAVMDSCGAITSTTKEYKLYENKAPKINSIDISSISSNILLSSDSSDNNSINLNKAKMFIDVSDDLDEHDDLEIQICTKRKGNTKFYKGISDKLENCIGYQSIASDGIYNKIIKKDGSIIDNSIRFLDGFDGKYSGQEYEVQVKIRDSYGKTATNTQPIEYKLYEDNSPQIEIFRITPYNNDYFNGKNISFKYKIHDPFDKYKVCISTKKTINNFDSSDCIHISGEIEYEAPESGDLEVLEDVEEETQNDTSSEKTDEKVLDDNSQKIIPKEIYDGEYSNEEIFKDVDYSDSLEKRKKGFYLHVKDSHGNIATSDITYYELYQKCSVARRPDEENGVEESDFSRKFVAEDSSKIISAKSCKGKCYLKDNPNNLEVNYLHTYSYFDRFLPECKDKEDCSISRDNLIKCSTASPEKEQKSCDFYRCFMQYDENELKNLTGDELEQKSKIYYKAIGKEKIEESFTRVVNGKSITYDSYYKTYNVTYDPYDMIVILSEDEHKMTEDEFNSWSFKDGNSNDAIRNANSYVLVDNSEDLDNIVFMNKLENEGVIDG